MNSSRVAALRPVAREILAYVSRHPGAQDTVEGIARWWLLEHRLESIVAEVHKAQAELTGLELLLERTGLDGRTYYRVNEERLDEIRKLLKARKFSGSGAESGPA